MSTGVLAVISNHDGVLYVDGERQADISPGKVVSLSVIAGQHFVDLRDSQGTKLWDKMVTVPAGAQAAEKIEVNSVSPANKTRAGLSSCPQDSLDFSELSALERTAETLPLAPTQAVADAVKKHLIANEKLLAIAISTAGQWPLSDAAFYGAGRYDEALRAASEKIEALKNSIPSVAGGTVNAEDKVKLFESLSIAYELRGRIKYALGNVAGAFSDLDGSLDYASQGMDASRSAVLLGAPPKYLIERSFPQGRAPTNEAELLQSRLRNSLNLAHLTRARILLHQRRFQDAISDANEVLGFRGEVNAESQVSQAGMIINAVSGFRAEGCEEVAPAHSSLPEARPIREVSATGGIASEIGQVVGSGHYSPLPASGPCAPFSGSGTLRTIENATSYQLRVVFSGPVDREVTIASRGKQTLNLPGGNYQVVGRVDVPIVLPFYGLETYKSGEECGVTFFIGPAVR
jgi:tetratricopeptide (TPR) repeat protein